MPIIDTTTLNIFIQYGALGVIAYFYIKNNNATAQSIHKEYGKLIDNLINTQNETLKDLKKAIEKLTDYITMKGDKDEN
jgi:hypothetical protein